MPLYEYRCLACSHEFEKLVAAGAAPICPQCLSDTLERLVSGFAVNSEHGRQRSLKTARKQATLGERERMDADLKRHHDH